MKPGQSSSYREQIRRLRKTVNQLAKAVRVRELDLDAMGAQNNRIADLESRVFDLENAERIEKEGP